MHDKPHLTADLESIERQWIKRRTAIHCLLAGGALIAAGRSMNFAEAGPAACGAMPEETAGPFPADGTAGDERAVPNVLTIPGLVRRDIRASFGTSTTVAPGVPLQISFQLLDLSHACRPLPDCAVYLWSCDRNGEYSLYGRGIEHENYLRGVQFADRNGQVRFQTIFPACYVGRYPHLHIEVFAGGASTLNAAKRILITQITAPRDICAQVYASDGYGRSLRNFESASTADDMVFGASSPAELSLQTVALSGDLASGFSGLARMGIRT